MHTQRTSTARQRGRRSKVAGVVAIAGLAVAASACGSSPAAKTSAPPTTARLSVAPGTTTCQRSWLSLNVAAAPGSGSGAVTHDVLTVTSTHACTLKGLPVFDAPPQVTGPAPGAPAEPRFTTTATGTPAKVTVAPGQPVVADATVSVPPGWLWGGGNLCATYVGAAVVLPGIAQPFVVPELPSVMVMCGAPETPHSIGVAVSPFTHA